MMKNDVQTIFASALSALNNRHLRKAEEGFRRVVDLAPSHVPALNLLTVVLMSVGRFQEAEPFIARAVSLNQDSDVSFYNYGLIARQLNKPRLAYEQFTKALKLKSNVPETWNSRGTVCNDLKDYEAAISDFDKAIELKRDYAAGYANKGKSLTFLKRYDEALAAYDKALSLQPGLAEAWLGRGSVFHELKHYDDALVAYDKALLLKPDLAEACRARGNAFHELKRHDDALAAYDQALSIRPDLAEAWRGRGNVFRELKRHDDALAAYDRALSIKPDLEGAWLGCGNVFDELKRYDDALAAYNKVLSTSPESAEAWLGRGNVFRELDLHDDALAAYDKALAIKPNLEGAWVGRGNVFTSLKSHDQAFAAYDKAFALRPDLNELEGARLFSKMQLHDWSNHAAEREHLISSVKSNKANTEPFAFLGFSASAEDQLHYARLWAARKFGNSGSPLWRGERYNHERIRIAYLSGDFRDHPVAHLLAGVFEQHDRKRFETIGVSFGPESPGETRARLKASFDRFIDVNDRDDAGVTKLLREFEVDIAVDLMGYTAQSRSGIFRHRPSPIQVNYLGYPGTMGVDWMDYMIADLTLIPEEQRTCYAEKVVLLPNCYMPNDRQRLISGKVFGREEMGLPQGFVFCCFNNSYKLNPDVFDGWMRILNKVEGSVLWLSETSAAAAANLRKEAGDRGVSADRLVFAKRLPSVAEHLARYRLADLFLDTLPYNAHATASDALWAGLPVLTRIGGTFAGRVAASLLNAMGMPELVTSSAQSYEECAIELATKPGKLAAIKQKLAGNRLTTPLFDTASYTRDIEAAYTAMYQRFQAALPPDHISVAR